MLELLCTWNICPCEMVKLMLIIAVQQHGTKCSFQLYSNFTLLLCSYFFAVVNCSYKKITNK